MTAAKWFSQPDSDRPTFGHFDTSMVADDYLRSILERLKFEMEQLNRGCEVAVPLRAQCWWPELTPIRYGYYMASFNETVLSAPLTTGELGTSRTVILPDANVRPGGYVEVVDKMGNAATTNITVKGVKGETIHGSLTYTINTNSAAVQFRSDGANWMVVGQAAGGTTSAGDFVTAAASLTADRLIVGDGSKTAKTTTIVHDPATQNLSGIGTIGSGAITSTGLIKSTSATAGIGYATGAGGTVTQATSKSTGVTLNKVCGQITMHNAALAAGATVTFAVTCSAFSVTADTVTAIPAMSGDGASAAYLVTTSCDAATAGTFHITVTNITAGSLSDALILNYTITKGVTS